MADWNGFDFFIVLIFAVNMLLGMSRGATKEIISMMCLSLALIFMIKFTVPLANFFNSSPLITNVVDNQLVKNFMLGIGAGPLTASLLREIFYSIALLVCFVSIFSISEAGLTYYGVQEYFTFPYATWSRKVGGALGFIRGYCIALILIAIFALHILSRDNNFISSSYFVRLFYGSAIKLDSLISEQNPERYREIYKDKDLYKPEDLYKQLN